MVENSRSKVSLSRRLAVLGVSLAFVAGACGSEADDGAAADAGVEAEAPEADSGDPAVGDASAEEAADAVSDEATTGDADLAPSGAVIQENGPISVTGSPLAPFDSTIPDDTVGTPSPVITGEDFDGSAVTLGAPTDNPTMIIFLAHWCPHCNDEIPELIALNDAGSLPADLDVIGVSTAVDPSAPNYPPSQWVVDKEWPWATMADDEELAAIAAMGGNSFPFTVILDSDGTVLARKGGQASAAETLDFINAALA